MVGVGTSKLCKAQRQLCLELHKDVDIGITAACLRKNITLGMVVGRIGFCSFGLVLLQSVTFVSLAKRDISWTTLDDHPGSLPCAADPQQLVHNFLLDTLVVFVSQVCCQDRPEILELLNLENFLDRLAADVLHLPVVV
eukprot:CAMPEP_0172682166 /NCGR_PEP_ID=MMETSP1074-20121228/17974_1 /TAXON_ID=2916 /ORGANISM="Ceratium fusus, Strain PA161109" /LENGTH=138 /DNA_ID=CAMNT_0013500803 /DNA_START=14 /DNA_END=430 /DNA_ORIENTATION=+